MAITNQIFLFTLILLFGCASKKNEVVREIRVYKVNESLSDLARYDTLILVPSQMEGLPKMIYDIDSVLEVRDEKIVEMLSYTISIEGYERWDHSKLSKYIVHIPVENGELTLFGIYAEDIGTVYLRWLDGSKSMVLDERIVIEHRYRYDDLIDYLDAVILAIPPRPGDSIQENREIESEIKIDTSMIK